MLGREKSKDIAASRLKSVLREDRTTVSARDIALMQLDVLAALSYLVQGRADNFRAVFRAWRDFLKWHPSLAEKRRAIQSSRKAGVRHIYRCSILLRYFLGGRTFGRLM